MVVSRGVAQDHPVKGGNAPRDRQLRTRVAQCRQAEERFRWVLRRTPVFWSNTANTANTANDLIPQLIERVADGSDPAEIRRPQQPSDRRPRRTQDDFAAARM